MSENTNLHELAHTVALMADLLAQYLDGTMSKVDAAANLHGLNARASAVWHATG